MRPDVQTLHFRVQFLDGRADGAQLQALSVKIEQIDLRQAV
jgi:hypothetical protein